ncbi:uncharacterized protein LOC125756705 [Rhipicephalus sanguineus]|uniref:uncharacterized protein LOC125756705 n=2 Tax=Rhipicephalus sanguineus TaxID=34632 RepID=UPI0020C2DECD|nr:uncharacterized protein LOC125756705 [Rhipicephalus sanguineus]
MPSCCVPGCKSRGSQGVPATSYHLFPKDAVRRTKWIEAIWPPHIRREPAKEAHVCSKHFLEEHFDRTSAFKVRLREHAVPTLLLPHPVQQGDRAPDAASTDSSFDSPQLMQGCAEGLLLLAQVAATSHEGLQACLSTPASPDLAAGFHGQSTLQQEAMDIQHESADPISLPDPDPSNLSASHFIEPALVQTPMDIGEESEAQASIATPGPSGQVAGIQWEPAHEQVNTHFHVT